MFVIGEVAVEEAIAKSGFSCDLNQCKGACCTLPGGRGAPLEDEEVRALGLALPSAVKYLSRKNASYIEAFGAVEGVPGSYATQCIDERDCVFVYYDDGIARCSIEKAYFEGESKFRKPVSCHLFPIRVSGSVSPKMRYEQIPECEGGRTRGRNDGTPLAAFLKDALIRKFGPQWYAEFEEACRLRA